ncbi:MAG TPA: ZIP family metal transporter [Solirubrobacterales bacterium]|nr:ZIP family metal transporter [Solirubrobacterales bacterium]
MSFGETVLLGALAGFTIYLGLPLGRVSLVSGRARVGLAMFSVGVLAFLFAEILVHGVEIVEEAVERAGDGEGSLFEAIGLALLLGGGFTAGSAGLALIERRLRRTEPMPPIAGGATDALTVEQANLLIDDDRSLHADVVRARALRVGMTIAAAIGLHNFAEGLAIGVSASTGEIGLATVLIIGFAVHNATEGFGIVGPLGDVRPSWRWLGVAGLVGGAPTFLGTIVGYNVTSEPLELVFYAVSAGAILYVVGEVWSAMRRLGHRELGLLMLAGGVFLGAMTEMVIAYGGG